MSFGSFPTFRFCAHSMILTLEGFTLPSKYIIKELTVISDSGDYQHFHFKTPLGFKPSAIDSRTIKFASTYLHQLSLDDQSLLPYSTIDTILEAVASHVLFVAGNSAYDFVTTKLPFTKVIDICAKYNFTYPKELPPINCFKRHRYRYCSLAKADCIKSFMSSIVQ